MDHDFEKQRRELKEVLEHLPQEQFELVAAYVAEKKREYQAQMDETDAESEGAT